MLDVSQQTITTYEVGRRRIQVSSLNVIAALLGVAVEELMGTSTLASGKRGPTPKLQQQMDRIAMLPKFQQRSVMQELESILAQARR